MERQDLAQFDVVITTYHTVAGEHTDFDGLEGAQKKKKKLERTLFQVQWKVCDIPSEPSCLSCSSVHTESHTR
jgi:hypothetical protein